MARRCNTQFPRGDTPPLFWPFNQRPHAWDVFFSTDEISRNCNAWPSSRGVSNISGGNRATGVGGKEEEHRKWTIEYILALPAPLLHQKIKITILTSYLKRRSAQVPLYQLYTSASSYDEAFLLFDSCFVLLHQNQHNQSHQLVHLECSLPFVTRPLHFLLSSKLIKRATVISRHQTIVGHLAHLFSHGCMVLYVIVFLLILNVPPGTIISVQGMNSVIADKIISPWKQTWIRLKGSFTRVYINYRQARTGVCYAPMTAPRTLLLSYQVMIVVLYSVTCAGGIIRVQMRPVYTTFKLYTEQSLFSSSVCFYI